MLRRLWIRFLMWRGAIRRYMGIRGSRFAFEDAAADFTRVIEMDPKSGNAYLQRGVLYWRELNCATLAVSDLTNALRLCPGWPEAIFHRGLAYVAMGRYADAITDFRAYLETGHPTWRADALSQLTVLGRGAS
jgi:regulator of sirC expression with transglutaminase-like and TPR domain